jgi:hypothetical protein
MKKIIYIFIVIASISVLNSCDKNVDIDMPAYTPSVVIEGFIVNGMPPLVVVTKNIPYVSNAGKDLYEQSFIHDAIVTIQNENRVDTLKEFLETDPRSGIKSYRYSSPAIKGEIGKIYKLTVVASEKTYTATATIPEPVNIEDIWFENHPDASNVDYKTVWIKINDPVGQNYYRYTTEVNGRHSAQPEISTVNDKAFEGKEFTKAIDSGSKNEEEDMHGGVSGYFSIGDTVTVKWANVEKSYYDVWSTIDFKRSQSTNPFMGPTRIVSNIQGGLGYWSGLGVSVKSVVLK